MNRKTIIFLPIIIAVSVAVGIVFANLMMKNTEKEQVPISIAASDNKINQIIRLINNNYVDTVSIGLIEDNVIPKMLRELDPHSVYIPKKDLERVNEELGSSFSGVGIQFSIQHDTVMAVSIISGGPSEKAGLIAGDRIVAVDDSVFVGKQITNEKVLNTLRGEKGTKVKVTVKRSGTSELLHYNIVRGDIPLYSVDVAYKIKDDIGYIKVSKFSENTYKEFVIALAKLKNQGCSKYIVDLRENSGGYLEQVVYMVNEFLPAGDLIVYTEGEHSPRNDVYATGSGAFQNNKLVVLIDEWSASASEIFSGAIQDNDRGTIIGRRSFGKGLVQQQIPLDDGSAIRLTIARYHTPSGRCIQKPYTHGDEEDYEMDILNRYLNGETTNADSVKKNDDEAEKFYTKNGRVVYGGGGITPDIFVARDTSDYSKYFKQAANYGYMYEFALKYVDENRETLKEFDNWKSMLEYLYTQPILDEFVKFAETKGLRNNIYNVQRSSNLILKYVYAYIARNMLNDEGFYPILNMNDEMVEKAIEVIEEEL